MKNELVGYRVVPLEGVDKKKLQIVIDIGFQRREKAVGEIQQARNVLTKASGKSSENLKKRILELGLPTEDTEIILSHILSNSLARQFEEVEPPRNIFEKPPQVEEKITNQEKGEMLDPAISRMRLIAQRLGINMPEDLKEKIFVFDEDLFNLVTLGNGDRSNDLDPVNIMGITLSNGLSVINIDKIKENANNENMDQRRLFELVAVHELWHTLSYKEEWNSDLEDQGLQLNLMRRSGFTTMRFGDLQAPSLRDHAKMCHVLHRLEEGFTQYLALVTLGYKLNGNIIYAEEAQEVTNIIEKIGLEPFLKANFTKQGFRIFSSALREYVEGKYNRKTTVGGALTIIGREMEAIQLV